MNRPTIAAVAAALAARGVRTQTGGGVRTVDDARALADAGVARVVLGTAAVARPELIDEVVAATGIAVAVGLDVRDREVAVKGWTEGAGSLDEVLLRFDGRPAEALVVTQIAVDGTGAGPDLGLYEHLLGRPGLIASGGIWSVADLAALRELGLPGAIVGRALYEGSFTLEEALACASPV